MNKDQIKGRVEGTKCQIKQVTGKTLDDDDMGMFKRPLAMIRADFCDFKNH